MTFAHRRQPLDRYGTLAPIGAGAMGRVYAGYDAERGIEVAIKRMRQRDAAAAARMRREARVLQRLHDPHLCPLLDWGEDGDEVWLVMPRLPGSDLDACLHELDLESRLQVLLQACAGVEAAHAAGLVHRDLKPANIRVDREAADGPHVWVMDFGIAHSSDETAMTAAGDVLGTPQYMSPEQAAGHGIAVDRRSDVWALGAILFEMLCGRAPFDAPTAAAVLAKVLSTDAPDPRRCNRSVPRALGRIALRCLERDPDRRYGSAGALAEDLRRHLAGRGVQAPANGAVFHLRRAFTRYPWTWLAAGLLGSGLLAALALAAWTNWRSHELGVQAAGLAQRAERVRSAMRIAHLAPLHDVRADYARIESDVAALRVPASVDELELQRLRSLAGAEAALGNLDAAIEAFDQLDALQAATPDDRLAAAEVLLRRYQSAFESAQNLPGEQATVVAEEAATRWLQPARELLPTDRDVPARLAARLALAGHDTDAALDRLASASSEGVHDDSMARLRAQIHLQQARQQRERGDPAAAAAALREAGKALDAALTVSRSDPLLLRQRCDWAIEGLRLSASHGLAPEATPAALDPACAGMSIALPDDAAGGRTELDAWETIIAAHDARNALDEARAALALAIADAGALIARHADDPDLLLARARLLRRQARFDYDDFERAQAGFDAALADIETAAHRRPGDWGLQLASGQLLAERGRLRANFQPSHGVDPLPDYRKAIELLEACVERRPASAQARQRLSLVHFFTFYALRDPDPDGAIAMARAGIDTLEPVLSAQADNPDVAFDQGANLGDLWLFRAVRSEADAIGATLPDLERALALLADVRRLAPQRVDGYSQALALSASAAERLRALGLARATWLAGARAILDDAAKLGVALDPSVVAWVWIETAEQTLDAGEIAERPAGDAAKALHEADAWLERAEAGTDHRFGALRYRVQWATAAARHARLAGLSSAHILRRGEEAVSVALASERGREDNIVLCEAGRLELERSRGLSGDAAIAAAGHSLDWFERCRARGELYFKAHYAGVHEAALRQSRSGRADDAARIGN